MNNNDFIQKLSDILSFRELPDGPIVTYISYLRILLDWVTSELGGKPVPDVFPGKKSVLALSAIVKR